MSEGHDRPNILFLMTDQQRFDTIAALGNPHIYTPNLDRLVRRGIAFTNAYTSCPVCVPARYNIRTGCEPPTSAVYTNGPEYLAPGQAAGMEERCGPFLGRRMAQLGYRTFGIGKFHSYPSHNLGFETFLRAEELWGSPEERAADAFIAFLDRRHPEFSFVEQPHGERTEMYYMPQTSPLPAELTYEAWAAGRAVEQMAAQDGPWFGFVSFIGPHPPFAPPIPYNRMYDPDRMPNPVRGRLAADHLDEQLPWMNYAIWADDIGLARARALKARYYGEITYIDACLGRILDAVEARPDAANTLICLFSDHGDMLGDHHAWQKESFFESSAHIPFLLSWAARLPADARRDDLVCLTDLFGIATGAAGQPEPREGVDVLAVLDGRARPRQAVVGVFHVPNEGQFKCMVRRGALKYIFMANGGREQLFDLAADPHELRNLAADRPEVARELRAEAERWLRRPGADRALDDRGRLRALPYQKLPRARIYQMDYARGVHGFPARPEDALKPR